jgi:hypothetical protein
MTERTRHLAQFNISRNRYPLDDPRMAEFLANVDRVHRAAERIEGFVWRLHDESGHAMNIRVYDDPELLPNLTVWESVEALERFVWQTLHRRIFDRRREWFVHIETSLVMWWIPAGYRPTMEEGVARLEHLKAHGPSDFAFGWDRLPKAQLWKSAHAGKPSGQAA